jgi:hypothetical protein
MPKLAYKQQALPAKKAPMINTEHLRESISQLKHDLNETPVSKHRHKQLSRELKDSEKKGFSYAIGLVFERILTLPRKVHWRILLDLADFAKRESKFDEAKVLFKLITHL